MKRFSTKERYRITNEHVRKCLILLERQKFKPQWAIATLLSEVIVKMKNNENSKFL